MGESSAVVDLPPIPPHLAQDPVLRRIKMELSAAYGRKLAGLVLYGSHARGDNRRESDIDVMVLLRGEFDKVAERWRLAQLSTEIFLDTGKSPSFLLREENALERQTIFNRSVREEGMRL